MKTFLVTLTVGILLSSAALARMKLDTQAGQEPETLKAEPKPGTPMGRFQVFYIDDHSCPAGQVKRFHGGQQIPRHSRHTRMYSTLNIRVWGRNAGDAKRDAASPANGFKPLPHRGASNIEGPLKAAISIRAETEPRLEIGKPNEHGRA